MGTIWHGFGIGRRLVPARIAGSMRGTKRSSRTAGSSSTAATVVLLRGEQGSRRDSEAPRGASGGGAYPEADRVDGEVGNWPVNAELSSKRSAADGDPVKGAT